MVFNKVFVEKELASHPRTQSILSTLKKEPVLLERYDDVWGKVKKPYLQKRDNLNLFIARKRGTLVKQTPPAYGMTGDPHYYFIHAYNCIYECEYCYLQGYFNSPDIVFFINHEEIIEEMQTITYNSTSDKVWFHAGEYSDSLALNSLTDELDVYFDFFKDNPKAILELRTKAVNIKNLLKLKPLENTIVSFTIAPDEQSKAFDHKCPSTKSRFRAIAKLSAHGFPIGLHFDPIMQTEDLENQYGLFINELFKVLPQDKLAYISLGVVRFTGDVYQQMKKHYPKSQIHGEKLQKSFDGKIRYPRPIRLGILNKVQNILLDANIDQNKIYFCMED